MAAIVEHHYWEIQTKRFNHFFRCISFIIYYPGTIAMQLVLYMSYHSDSNVLSRILMIILIFVGPSLIFYTNVMSTWIAKAAHKPLALVLSYMSSRRRVLSVRDRLRVQAFIERLCGPAIGYYCYDLFPMNSHAFAQYLIISCANYLLIITLF